MPHRVDIQRIVRLLEKQRIVSRVEVILVDEIERRGFYKLRASLIPSRYKLDIKFIRSEKELLYSYQCYERSALARWDNEPHYPRLDNYPHHFHLADNIVQSNLTGNPEKDIVHVCSALSQLIATGSV